MAESPASFDRVTCLPQKNASAPWGGVGSRWLTIIVWQVSYVQYLLACQKLQRSTPYNIVKNGLPWKRVFRRRHLGRRVTAFTCLRCPPWIRSNEEWYWWLHQHYYRKENNGSPCHHGLLADWQLSVPVKRTHLRGQIIGKIYKNMNNERKWIFRHHTTRLTPHLSFKDLNLNGPSNMRQTVPPRPQTSQAA